MDNSKAEQYLVQENLSLNIPNEVFSLPIVCTATHPSALISHRSYAIITLCIYICFIQQLVNTLVLLLLKLLYVVSVLAVHAAYMLLFLIFQLFLFNIALAAFLLRCRFFCSCTLKVVTAIHAVAFVVSVIMQLQLSCRAEVTALLQVSRIF